jgi:hypothetical protein
MMALPPCSYWKFPDDPVCSSSAFYLLELVARQGQRCQTTVCRDHVHKAWEFGQAVLDKRFPNRNLKLSSVRLMPILEVTGANKKPSAKAAGASGDT